MTFMQGWLLIAVVVGTLVAFWYLLELTADAFSQWWNASREEDHIEERDIT